MTYQFDPSEPVRRYHAWEQEFERRQALRREPLDAPAAAALSPWSLFTGLMAAMREATGHDRRDDDASVPFVAPGREPVEQRCPAVGEDERVLVGTAK